MKNKSNRSKNLELIRSRYFNGNNITHYFDCEIYRSLEAHDFSFCSCGLLHDLQLYASDMVDVLYPDYWNDYNIQEFQEPLKNNPDSKEEQEETEKILYEIFGPLPEDSIETIKAEYDEQKKLIQEVFGKHSCIYLKVLYEKMEAKMNKRRRLQ
jgi:hypothetical protein